MFPIVYLYMTFEIFYSQYPVLTFICESCIGCFRDLATHKMHLVTLDPDNWLQLRELASKIRKGHFKTG